MTSFFFFSQWKKLEPDKCPEFNAIFRKMIAYRTGSDPIEWVNLGQRLRSLWSKINLKIISTQRTQTPPRLWPLTLSCDLYHSSRSRKLMSLDVANCIVPWHQVCNCINLRDMTVSSFFVTFYLRLWPSSSVKVTFIFSY